MSKRTAVIIAVLAIVAYLAYHHAHSQQCYVTGMGAKLCGSDAAAWCRTTDPLRQSTRKLGVDTSASEQACQDAESNNP